MTQAVRIGKRVAGLTLALAGWSLAATAAPDGTVPPQNPARVREIAAMLRPEPGFAETRIGNRDGWEKARASDPKGAETVIRRAEKLIAEPMIVLDESKYLETYTNECSTSSDVYPWWTKERFLSDQLGQLTFAECLENRGRFLPRITEILDQFSFVCTWVNPYHDTQALSFKGKIRRIELCGGIVAMSVATTLDLLKDVLRTETVTRAKRAVLYNEVDVYLAMARDMEVGRRSGHFWAWSAWNWNAACSLYMVSSALYLVDDPMERAAAIELAERTTPIYLNGFNSDGLSLEGPGYWSYGFGCYLQLGIQIRRATDMKDPFFNAFTEKIMASGFENRYNDVNAPAYGDNGSKSPSPPPGGTWFLGSLVWPRFACPIAGRHRGLSAGLFTTLITRFPCAGVPKDLSYDKPYAYPIRSWYEDDAQQLFCRPAPGATRALYACFKGGHNGAGHNHNDIGTYTVAIDGLELVCDPGVKAYAVGSFGPKRYESAIRNSYGHPVPVVDGVLQSAGKKFAAKLLEKSFGDELDSVTLDLAGAYECTNLTKLVRRFEYARAKGEIVVTDDVKFARPGAFESPLVTFGTIEKKGENSYEIVSRDGRDRVRCEVRATGGTLVAREELLESTGCHQGSTRGRPRRLAFAFAEPVAEGRIVLTYSKVGR